VLPVTVAENGRRQTGAMKGDRAMTLTILDPRTGQKVTVTVPDKPRTQRPVPAEVIRHPSCLAVEARQAKAG
jgi:hypothetical protein